MTFPVAVRITRGVDGILRAHPVPHGKNMLAGRNIRNLDSAQRAIHEEVGKRAGVTFMNPLKCDYGPCKEEQDALLGRFCSCHWQMIPAYLQRKLLDAINTTTDGFKQTLESARLVIERGERHPNGY